MYNDPYTFLQKAQIGFEVPIEADYKSYDEYQKAYNNWRMLNSGDPTASSIIKQDPVLAKNPSLVNTPSLIAYEGPSVWDFLTAQGVKGDLPTRKKIAKILNIKNYTGLPNQNKRMIELIEQNPEVVNTIAQIVVNPSSSKTASEKIQQANLTGAPGNKIDTIVNKQPLTTDTSKSKVVPPAPFTKNKKSEESEDSQFEKALIAMFSIAAAGGMTAAAINEAKVVAKTSFGLKGKMLEQAVEALTKNVIPTAKTALKQWKAMGDVGQEAYNYSEKMIQREVAARKKKLNLVKEQRAARLAGKSSPTPIPKKGLVTKFTPPVSSTPTPAFVKPAPYNGVRPFAPAPTEAPLFSRYARQIKESPFYKGAAKYADELGAFAKAKSPAWLTKMVGSVASKFEEGGEQEMMNQQGMEDSEMEQRLVSYIASQLQNNIDPQEIVQDLMSQGLPQDQAAQIIEQVAMFLEQRGQGVSRNQQQDSEEEQMRYGGYSGTYDMGSGSYFAQGGSFVPTYGDILPEYMYGHMMEEGGSLNIGDTLDVSPEEMEYLRQQGYQFDTI